MKIQAFDLALESKFSIYRRDIWYSETMQLPGASLLFAPVVVDQSVPTGTTGNVCDILVEDYDLHNNCHYDYVLVNGANSYRDSATVSWRGWTLSELAQQTSEVDGFDQYFVDQNNVWKFKYNVSTGDFT